MYKFVLGMDVLVPHGAVVDTAKRLLRLQDANGKPIWLPLKSKEEVKQFAIIKKFADWKKQYQDVAADVLEWEDLDDLLFAQEASLVANLIPEPE